MSTLGVNRRQFLKSAAILGATALVPTVACGPATPAATPAAPAPAGTSAAGTAPQAATSAPTVIASSGPLRKIRLVSGTGTSINPILLGQTIGIELGFYKEEGLDFEIIPASGSGGAGTMIAAGQGELANTNAPQFILGAEAGNEFPLITIYNWTKDIHWRFGVPEGSPYKGFEDLIGAKIGYPNQGDSSFPGGMAMLRESGLDPENDVEWIAVGTGAPAAEAIRTNRVDALSMWDGLFAGLENIGLKFTYFDLPPLLKQIMGTGIGTHTDLLKSRREDLVGFLRGMTKGTVFALANPEESIKIHWKLYPETKPTGKSDEEALKETLHIVASRSDKWPLDPEKLPRWGENLKEGWEASVKVFDADPEKVGDVTRFYTNELIDEVNNYDYDKITEMAKSYKFNG